MCRLTTIEWTGYCITAREMWTRFHVQLGARRAMAILAVAVVSACAPPIRSTLPGPPSAGQLAELWVEPDGPVSLFFGVGGEGLAPEPAARYRVLEIKKGGFSAGYTVQDPESRQWSAKFDPEAHTEVVASRLLWAFGYPQPPVYFLRDWTAEGGNRPNPQTAARFREEKPAFHGLTEAGNWSYHAGGYTKPIYERYLRRLRQKIQDGLALKETA